MRSLPIREQERALREAVLLWKLKNEEDASDEEIAERLRYGSVEAMHMQHRRWDLPHWIAHDEEATQGAKTSKPAPPETRTGSGRRKATKFEEVTPLPPAEEAIPYFKGILERLLRDLEKLRGRDEFLQSGRFGAVSERDGERKAWGVLTVPPEPLRTLIAIVALRAGRARSPAMTKLLRLLHPSEAKQASTQFSRHTFPQWEPDSGEVNMGQLASHMEALEKHADNVAKLVRGLERISDGRRPVEILSRDHAVIDLVRQRAAQGVPDQEIRDEVNRVRDRGPLGPLSPDEDFTLKDIQRLKTYPFEGGMPPDRGAK
jgi:hypothetical protein